MDSVTFFPYNLPLFASQILTVEELFSFLNFIKRSVETEEAKQATDLVESLKSAYFCYYSPLPPLIM